MLKKFINVVGANEHNLQNVSVQIPRDKLTVITGLRVLESPPWPLILFMQKGKKICRKLIRYARQFRQLQTRR